VARNRRLKRWARGRPPGAGRRADRGDRQPERARAYFDVHGEWPEETPREGRRWVLPAGVVTYEQEQAQLRASETAGHVA
jgi:hypothetical protein